MWFKNLHLYHLQKPFKMPGVQLNELLHSRAFRHAGTHDASSLGWTAPLGRTSEQLVHEAGGCIVICSRQEDKLLPPMVINEALEEKIETIEAEESRKVSRRERSELRDEIIFELLPKAFTRSIRTYAMIDRQNDWILVDASSANRAESLLSLLRESLGSLSVQPFETANSPSAVLSEWLENPEKYTDFNLLDSCELRDITDQDAVIRCKGQDLSSSEILAHLSAGKQVVKLAVAWDERISCVLESDLAIKRIKFLDIVQEQAAEVEGADELIRFDLLFTLMSLEFRRLIPRILQLFGGLAVTE